MSIKRIKRYLKKRKKAWLQAFEIAHFLIDVVIVVHILVPFAMEVHKPMVT
jgi:hypothetical protein